MAAKDEEVWPSPPLKKKIAPDIRGSIPFSKCRGSGNRGGPERGVRLDTDYCPFQSFQDDEGVDYEPCSPDTCGIYSDNEGNCSILVIAESMAQLLDIASRLFDKFMGKDPVLDVAGPDPDPSVHGDPDPSKGGR